MGISKLRLMGPISFLVCRFEGESKDSLIFMLSSEAAEDEVRGVEGGVSIEYEYD